MFQPLPPVYDLAEKLEKLFQDLEVCTTCVPRHEQPNVLESTLNTTTETEPIVKENDKKPAGKDGKVTATEPTKRATRRTLVKRVHYTVDAETGPMEVASWKFDEFAYSESRVIFPIRARGLFTYKEKILARGYDKFFNVGEVPATTLSLLELLEGPFYASTKENGCVILISGLEDGTLLVCSKHSTGSSRIGFTSKHFVHAKNVLYEQLEKNGKSPRELANTLYSMNATAVLELCDDSFEEHIVKYPTELAGLYLHGINYNLVEFKTYPVDKVQDFAETWGFRKVTYHTFENFEPLWSFLNELKNKGVYEGRELEGFVVRCKKNNGDFLFKFKFDEPYYLFRQLRSVAWDLTPAAYRREATTTDDIPFTPISQIMKKVKKHQVITLDYLHFVKNLFKEDKQMRIDFNNSIGIIHVRELYLKHKGFEVTNGMGLLDLDKDELLSDKLNSFMSITKTHYVIMPISIPGSGKTTTFKTLTNLFPNWKHAQNDDFQNFGDFIKTVLQNVDECEVLFADMNFHNLQTRKTFFEAIESQRTSFVRPDYAIAFIGINFLGSNEEEAWQIAQRRIISRGDNHQSVQGASDPNKAINVARSFYHAFTPPKVKPACKSEEQLVVKGENLSSPDNNFDYVVNLKIDGDTSSLVLAKTIFDTLKKNHQEIILGEITDEQWDNALKKALDYEPTFRKIVKSSKDERRAEYYGVRIESPDYLKSVVSENLLDNPVWISLQMNHRVQQQFHVTLGHCASINKVLAIEAPAPDKQTKQSNNVEIPEKSSSITSQEEVTSKSDEPNRIAQKAPEKKQKTASQTIHGSDPAQKKNLVDAKEVSPENNSTGISEVHQQLDSVKLDTQNVDNKAQPDVKEAGEQASNESRDINDLPDVTEKKKKRYQKKTGKKKESKPMSYADRWQELGRRFGVGVWKDKAKLGEPLIIDQFCDIHVRKIVAVENKLVVLKVEVSDPFKFVDGNFEPTKPKLTPMNDHLHITLGTCAADIPPRQSNDYLTLLEEEHPGLPAGEYEIKKNRVWVYDVDHCFEKQPVFIQFRRFGSQNQKTSSSLDSKKGAQSGKKKSN